MSGVAGAKGRVTLWNNSWKSYEVCAKKAVTISSEMASVFG